MGELQDCGAGEFPCFPPTLEEPPRFSHTATVVGTKIYLFGGVRGQSLLNDVHIFDTDSGRWVTPKVLGTPPTPRSGHSAVVLNDERILIVGGSGIMVHDTIWFLEVDTPFVRRQRQCLGKEVVAWSKAVIGHSPQPVVICGPSGVGKGTLISRLMKEFPSTFGFSVSHTTRLPREREKDGVHYHFTKHNIMEQEVQEGKFLESAIVHGNLYGTSIAAVDAVADAGKRCILDIDVQGAQAVKKSSLDALFIFISPPSFEELERRLRGRGTETEEQVQKRLKNAKAELEQQWNTYLFDHILVNDDLDICYMQLKRLLGLESSIFYRTQNGFEQPDMLKLGSRSGHSASIFSQKVLIYGGQAADRKALNNVVVLDISRLVGGAPGRTRGLKCSVLDAKADTPNGVT